MREELLNWCCEALQCNQHDLRIETLSGDAGFRRYYRLFYSGISYIAVDAPPKHINNPVFADIAARLTQAGTIVPSIIAKDFNNGFLILSDLGDELLLKHLNDDSVNRYYRKGLQLIMQMQKCDTSQIPQYDRAVLRREMSLFSEWFVAQLLGHTLDNTTQRIIDDCFNLLEAQAIQQPYRFVHRDFHSRNILIYANELATIDFQDALVGPITYDAVSLLKDCYIRWPNEQVELWLKYFHDLLMAEGTLPANANFDDTKKDFHLMGLQRHIKVLGIFARLSLRDNKHQYLNDLPLVIAYTLEALRLYANQFKPLDEFLTWFETDLNPLIEQQEWARAK